MASGDYGAYQGTSASNGGTSHGWNQSGGTNSDPIHNWGKDKNNEQIQQEQKEPNTYPIWDLLQRIEDELHDIYTAAIDFSDLAPSVMTEAKYRNMPFKTATIYGQLTLLMLINTLSFFLVAYFTDQLHFMITSIFVSFVVLYAFPLYVVIISKQWVSGGRHTKRYYSHIANIKKMFVFTLALWTMLIYFSKSIISLEFLTNLSVQYLPKFILNSRFFDLDRIYHAFSMLVYDFIFLTGLILIYSYLVGLKAGKLQKMRKSEIMKHMNSNANVAEDIMNNNEF